MFFLLTFHPEKKQELDEGNINPENKHPSLFEPVHGSAPDIAGAGIANPIACILSFAMCLKYSFAMDSEAEKINEAVNNVLTAGFKTKDLIGNNEQNLSINLLYVLC